MARVFDPATFTVKEKPSVKLRPMPGMLYRHDTHPSVYRCTSVEESRRGWCCVMELVWCMPGFDPERLAKTLAAITRDPTVLRCELGQPGGYLYGWELVDAAWLGLTWRGLTDLIRNEFGDGDE